MAVTSERVSVTTQATVLADQAQHIASMDVLITNQGAVVVDIGPATVTSGGGYALAPSRSLSLTLTSDDDAVYGIVATGTCRVDVVKVQ